MENRKLLKKVLPYLVIVVLAAIARIIPHAPNFAPIAGLAIFTGYHFKNRYTWAVPIAAMVVSDFIIGFHSTVPFVYASFIVMSLIGTYMKSKNASSLILVSMVSSVLFFLVTNFGVWAVGSIYVKNMSGLLQSYTIGLPFFRNTVLGDLFYTFSFFYGFEYLRLLANRKNLLGKPA